MKSLQGKFGYRFCRMDGVGELICCHWQREASYSIQSDDYWLNAVA